MKLEIVLVLVATLTFSHAQLFGGGGLFNRGGNSEGSGGGLFNGGGILNGGGLFNGSGILGGGRLFQDALNRTRAALDKLDPTAFIRERNGTVTAAIVQRVKDMIVDIKNLMKNTALTFIPGLPDTAAWSAEEENGRNSIFGFLNRGRKWSNKTYNYTHVDYYRGERNIITPVKDQGKCGSCYAFGGLAAVEAQQRFHGVGNDILSEQEVVDCSYKKYRNDKGPLNLGCTSGTSYHTMQYIAEYDHALAKDYKYTGRHGTCKTPEEAPRVPRRTLKFQEVWVENEHHACFLLQKNGPFVVYIKVTPSFNYYKAGVYNDKSCKGDVNHAMLLVACTLEPNGKESFTLKNSWGPKWGDQGFIKFEKGLNLCDMFTNNVTIASYGDIITE